MLRENLGWREKWDKDIVILCATNMLSSLLVRTKNSLAENMVLFLSYLNTLEIQMISNSNIRGNEKCIKLFQEYGHFWKS